MKVWGCERTDEDKDEVALTCQEFPPQGLQAFWKEKDG
jgi:hypothetical protein